MAICGHDYWVKYIVLRKSIRQFISISLFTTVNIDILGQYMNFSCYMENKGEIGNNAFY